MVSQFPLGFPFHKSWHSECDTPFCMCREDLDCIQHILGWSEKSKSLRFRVAIKGNPHKTLAGDQVQTGPGSLRVEWLRGGKIMGFESVKPRLKPILAPSCSWIEMMSDPIISTLW